MGKEPSGKNYTKIGAIVAVLALIIAIIGLLFDNGLFWRIKEYYNHDNTVVDNVATDSDTPTNGKTTSDLETGEIENNDNTAEVHVSTSREIVAIDNQCAQESHGIVKNESELSGFIYWNGLESFERSYFHTISGNSSTADNREPLHHVFLDLSRGDYSGMSINISLYGDPNGLNMVSVYDGEIIEFYISEGHFTITAEIWEDDSTYVFESMDVVIDHCGSYSLYKD